MPIYVVDSNFFIEAHRATYPLDVAHHGSRRNLSVDLIDTTKPTVCFISAEGGNKHLRRVLVNCLRKLGARVYSTPKGENQWPHAGNFPARADYSAVVYT